MATYTRLRPVTGEYASTFTRLRPVTGEYIGQSIRIRPVTGEFKEIAPVGIDANTPPQWAWLDFRIRDLPLQGFDSADHPDWAWLDFRVRNLPLEGFDSLIKQYMLRWAAYKRNYVSLANQGFDSLHMEETEGLEQFHHRLLADTRVIAPTVFCGACCTQFGNASLVSKNRSIYAHRGPNTGYVSCGASIGHA